MFENRKMDYALGIKLPAIIQELGLQQLCVENDALLANGGSGVATVMKMSALQLAEKYIATGTLDDPCQAEGLAVTKSEWLMRLDTRSVGKYLLGNNGEDR